MSTQLQRIQAAVIDGRARTPRYIQKQLTLLHDSLLKSVSSIHQAIIHDTGVTVNDAWFEIYTTFKTIKQEYESINFKQVIEDEYSIVREKNNISRRVPFGCSYIIPSQYTRFYSVIQPLSVAIAAGNCVVIELKQTISEVDQLLRDILTQTLDKDTFTFLEQVPMDDKFLSTQTILLNSGDDHKSDTEHVSRCLTSPSSRVVAVVDRSANIAEAAKAIVRARFHFNGKSPYAPDVVFVNEFAAKEFCEAAIQSITQQFSDFTGSDRDSKLKKKESAQALQKELEDSGATNLITGQRGSIYITTKRNSRILEKKISEAVLLIYPVKSLDDAIDLANNTNSPLLSTYLYAAPGAAKYLSQFIISNSSFVNHIPAELLVGPAAPRDFKLSIRARYTKEMFSIPSPEIIKISTEEQSLMELLDAGSKKALDKVKSDIEVPLTKMGEAEGTTVGFFEQGLHTGALLELTCLVGLLGVGLRYSVPVLLRRFR